MKQSGRAMAMAGALFLLLPGWAGAQTITTLLDGLSVGTEDLHQASARGLPDAFNTAVVQSNSVGSGTVTGAITNVGSVNNNSGLTTVLQNSGNNTLFQTTTILNITLK